MSTIEPSSSRPEEPIDSYDEKSTSDFSSRYFRFPMEGLTSLHFFIDHLAFPIAIAAYGETQQMHAIYFAHNVSDRNSDTAPCENWLTTYDIISWCETHGFRYQIMYPIEAISYGRLRAWTCAFFRQTVRCLDYIRLRIKVNREFSGTALEVRTVVR